MRPGGRSAVSAMWWPSSLPLPSPLLLPLESESSNAPSPTCFILTDAASDPTLSLRCVGDGDEIDGRRNDETRDLSGVKLALDDRRVKMEEGRDGEETACGFEIVVDKDAGIGATE